jgi:hypothetical protein
VEPLFYVGNEYTRRQISTRVGGGMQEALPVRDAIVVAACLRRDQAHNPDAPEVILAGDSQRVAHAAELLASQTAPVPVFVFNSPNRWEYRGEYQSDASFTRGPEFDKWVARGSRRSSEISRVVLLRVLPQA